MNLRLGIRNRLLVLVGVLLVFIGAVVLFFVFQSKSTKEQTVARVGQIMIEDAEDKIKVLTQSMATSISNAIKNEPISDHLRIIKTLVNDIRYEVDSSGYFFVLENTTYRILPPNPEIEGIEAGDSKDANNILFVRELMNIAKSGGGFVHYNYDKPGKGVQPKISYSTMIPGTGMWIGTGIYVDNISAAQAKVAEELDEAAAKSLIIALSFIGIGFLLLILPFTFFLIRSIITPLQRMIGMLKDIAQGEGDLTARLRDNSGTETQELAEWFNKFVVQVHGIIRDVANNSNQVNQASVGLLELATHLRKSSGEMADKSSAVAVATEQMSSNMNSVASAMEEFSINISTFGVSHSQLTTFVH